jgi:predicted N-formylglutamate amidohydrolase
MDDPARATLLADDEPRPFQVERPAGRSAFVLICDHAGTRIPRRLASLGLQAADVQRHIGWDIGAAQVASKLADALDATLILQPYSRLVIDCTRPLHSPESIDSISVRTSIPGNQQVSESDAARRRREIFVPYHARIREALDARRQDGRATLLVALHTFTPVYLDQARPWHVGVLYNRDARMARALGAALAAENGLVVGDNQPYDVSDETDYSIPEHGERRGLPHVEIEIRQDLVADEHGQQDWALRLARLLLPLSEAFASP